MLLRGGEQRWRSSLDQFEISIPAQPHWGYNRNTVIGPLILLQ